MKSQLPPFTGRGFQEAARTCVYHEFSGQLLPGGGAGAGTANLLAALFERLCRGSYRDFLVPLFSRSCAGAATADFRVAVFKRLPGNFLGRCSAGAVFCAGTANSSVAVIQRLRRRSYRQFFDRCFQGLCRRSYREFMACFFRETMQAQLPRFLGALFSRDCATAATAAFWATVSKGCGVAATANFPGCCSVRAV